VENPLVSDCDHLEVCVEKRSKGKGRCQETRGKEMRDKIRPEIVLFFRKALGISSKGGEEKGPAVKRFEGQVGGRGTAVHRHRKDAGQNKRTLRVPLKVEKRKAR